MLLKIFTSGPVETHSYLIGCPLTRAAAIIDAPPGITPEILKAAAYQELKVEKILITHSHWDHIADAAQMKKSFQAPLYIHASDEDNLKRPGSDRLPLYFPIEASQADFFFKEGDQIQVGELELKVLETPGHTPGCVCFWLPKEKVLFSGDTLFRGSLGNIGFPTSNPSFMWESLKKLAKLPPETKVYPGHGASTTIGAESWMDRAQELYGDD